MKIQLKRSNALDGSQAKPPAENNMDSGELAINFSAQDPSLFIKDDNGTLRKLPVNDTSGIQSDWAENNTGSPAHIKNREIVNSQFNAVNAELSTKLESAPLNGDQYGHQNGSWTKIEVQEANKDSKQYVRKDGDWAEIQFEDVDLSGYPTQDYVDNEIQASTDFAILQANSYTNTKHAEALAADEAQTTSILAAVGSQGYLTDATGSINNDGNYYARLNGTWVPFDPSGGGTIPDPDGGGGGSVDLSGYAQLNATQAFSGYNTFSGGIASTNTFAFPNSVNLVPWSGTVPSTTGQTFTAYGFEFKWASKTGGGGTGGGIVAFQRYGQNGSEVGNAKVGIRTTQPTVALEVQSTVKFNQIANFSGGVFDGTTFTSPKPFEFQQDAVFFNDVIQNGRVYTSIHSNQRSYATYRDLDKAEMRAATTIRSLVRGYVHNNKRSFSIDRAALVSAFTNQGLDITNYDILKDVTVAENPGLVEEEDGLDEGRHGEMNYAAVDYQSLFMFLIASLPDFDSIEARLAALEA